MTDQITTDEQRLKDLLQNISSYMEQYHNGWVKYVEFDGKVLKVQLGGACNGCDLTQTTLNGWIAGTIKPFFPQIESVEAV